MSGMGPKPADQSTEWPHEDVKDTHQGLKRKPDANGGALNSALEDTFPASDPPAATQPQPATTKPGDADPPSGKAEEKGGG